MAEYSFFFFAGPRLLQGGRLVHLSPAHSALLSLAVAAGESGATDSWLNEIMWKDDPPRAALKHRLAQACYGINARAGARLVLRRHGRCWVNPDLLRTDLEAFDRALEAEDLETAIDLLSQGFLPQLHSVCDDRLSDWIEGREITLRSSVRRAALSTWSRLAAVGDWTAATPHAIQLLKLDPSDESALQRLLRSRAMSGGVLEAHASFAEFVERQTVGGRLWSPSMATMSLLERLSLSEKERPPFDTGFSDPASEPPFLGREVPLRGLTAALHSTGFGEFEILLVSGEAGMGKTRLIREALAESPPHLRVLKGTAHELERDILLNPLLEAIGTETLAPSVRGLPEPWRATLLTLLPHFHIGSDPPPEPPDLTPDAIPRRLFEAFRTLFRQVSSERPVLLIIEDFHWIDDTSLAVLEYLRRRWTEGGLRLLLSVRPEDLEPNCRSARWLSELRAKRVLKEFNLAELEEAALHTLVDSVMPSSASALERQRLRCLSGSNPYFVIELAAEWSSGRLPLGSPMPDPLLPVPHSICQVFERRLRALSPTAERCASLLAILDDPIEPAYLTRLARLRYPRVLAALQELQGHRLVEMSHSGVRMRHDLVRQALRGRFDQLWRSWLHGRVAQGLLRRRSTAVDRLALHFHRAGDREQALAFSLRAAARAEATGAVPEAIGFYLIAKMHTNENEDLARITGQLGSLHFIHRDFDSAIPLLGEAAMRYQELGHVRKELRLLVLHADARSHQEKENSEEVLGEVRRLVTAGRELGDVEGMAEALDVELHILDRMERPKEVVRVLAQANSTLSTTEDAGARSALFRVLSLHLYYGEKRQALISGRAAVSEARKSNRADRLLSALNRLVVVLLHLGLLDSEEGRAILSEAEALSAKSGDLFMRYNIILNEGVWALDVGSLDRAEICFHKAAQVVPTETDLTHFVLCCNIGELRVAQRRFAEAEEVFQKARAIWRPGMPLYLRGVVDAGIGLCALESGRVREAQQVAEALPEPPTSWFFDPSVLIVFQTRLLDRLGRTEEGLRLVSVACEDLRDRFVTAWVKLRLEHHRVAARRGLAIGDEVRATLGVAGELGLDVREREIGEILLRLG
jgi:DNA-binding SARP family transcriptional activator